jgi:internalin A
MNRTLSNPAGKKIPRIFSSLFAAHLFVGLLVTAASAQIPSTTQRLGVLRKTYEAAYHKEVTSVHTAALKDLDAKYSAALDRALAAATQSGQLDTALALRDEKKRLTDAAQLPADDFAAPETLKTLRLTYRSALASLEARRDQTAAPVKAKYDDALASLQNELTKSADLDGALTIRRLREDLKNEKAPSLPSETEDIVHERRKSGDASDKAPEAKVKPQKYDPAAAEALVEWVFAEEGDVFVQPKGSSSSQLISWKNPGLLPKGEYELHAVQQGGAGGSRAAKQSFPWDQLIHVPTLTDLRISQREPLTSEQTQQLAALPNLQTLMLFRGAVSEATLRSFPVMPKVKRITFTGQSGSPRLSEALMGILVDRFPNAFWVNLEGLMLMGKEGISHTLKWKTLYKLNISGHLNAETTPLLLAHPNLKELQFTMPESTVDPAQIAEFKKLEALIFFDCQGGKAAIPYAAKLPKLTSLGLRGHLMNLTAADLAPLAGFKALETLIIPGNLTIDDAAMSHFTAMNKLRILDIRETSVTDAGLAQLAGMKQLTEVMVKDSQVTPAGAEALKKVLPKCKVSH